jgi:hypothetical protein
MYLGELPIPRCLGVTFPTVFFTAEIAEKDHRGPPRRKNFE